MSLRAAWRKGDDAKRPGWAIQFDFDAEEVEALKRAVPWTHREWIPLDGIWWVHIDYEETLVKLWPAFEAYKSQMSMF